MNSRAGQVQAAAGQVKGGLVQAQAQAQAQAQVQAAAQDRHVGGAADRPVQAGGLAPCRNH